MTAAELHRSSPRPAGQMPVVLLGLGHGATHWVAAIFLFLQPYFREDLGLTYLQAGMLVAIFHVSSFAANLGSGALVDVTGRRVAFQVASLVIGGAALLVFGMTGIYAVLALMVALIGGSNNLWHPPALTFLSALYPTKRGFVLAIHGLGASVGDAIGPLAAGLLLTGLTWQGTAMVSAVPVFLVAILLLIVLLPRDTAEAGGLPKKTDARAYLNGLGGLLRDPAVLGLSLAAGFRAMAQNGLLIYLPFYLVDVIRFDPLVAGLALTAMHIGGLVASPIAGHLSDKIGRRPVVLAGASLTSVIIVAATFVTDPTFYVAMVAVLGFVLYAIRPAMQGWILDLAPADMTASTTSVMFGVQATLSALMPLLGGLIADAYGLVEVFYALAAIMLVANVLIAVLPRIVPRMRA